MRSTSQESGDTGRAAIGRLLMTAVLVAMDFGLVAVAAVAWRAIAGGTVTNVQTWPITLLGGNAVVGIAVLVVVGAANTIALQARRTGRPVARARSLATTGQWLAVARLVALFGVAVLCVAAVGATSTWLTDLCLLATCVFDAVLTFFVAAWTGRGVRPAPAS